MIEIIREIPKRHLPPGWNALLRGPVDELPQLMSVRATGVFRLSPLQSEMGEEILKKRLKPGIHVTRMERQPAIVGEKKQRSHRGTVHRPPTTAIAQDFRPGF